MNFLSEIFSAQIFSLFPGNFFLIFGTIFLTLFSIFLVQKIFPKIGFLDKPEKFGYSRKSVPYPAGIIIPIIFFLIIFLIFPITKPLLGFFFASVILVITSFIDDKKGLSPIFRLGVQGLVAGIIIFSGIGIDKILNPIGGVLDLTVGGIQVFGHYFYPIADSLLFFWIIGMINTMNWIDGISGNTSGISALSGWLLYFLAISPFVNQPDIAQIFLVFALITSIFFIFDLETPKILMGDSGSMFLGFAIAVFSVFAGGKMATAMIIMGIPIFDAIYTIYRRLKNGKNPLKGDMKHFHHILLEKGFSRRNAVLLYILLSAGFGIPTIFLDTEGKFILLILLCVFMGFLQFFLRRK